MSSIVVGMIPAGRVDTVAGEPVETEFFIVGLPIVPFASSMGGNPIRLHPKSILAAYVRWWFPVVAFCTGFMSGELLVPALLMVAWASSFVWGRAWGRTVVVREALAEATKVSIPPHMVDPTCLKAAYRGLVRAARRGGDLSTSLALGLYHQVLEPTSAAAATLAREAELAIRGLPFDGVALAAAEREVLATVDVR